MAPTPTVVLRGDGDLKTETIPTSWIAKDALLRSKEFSIKESDLGKITRRLAQEKYWRRNVGRETLVEFNFEDRFIKEEWTRKGERNGKIGEFWNPSKLEKLQEELEAASVPEDFISMKEVKKFFGRKVTLARILHFNFEVKFGRKMGQRGRCGHYVEPNVLENQHLISGLEQAVPVSHIFSLYPSFEEESIPEIVEKVIDTDKDVLLKSRVMTGNGYVSKRDLTVKTKILDDLDQEASNSCKLLRSKRVTSVDVSQATKKLRTGLVEGKASRKSAFSAI